MNNKLKNMFDVYYNPVDQSADQDRGGSSMTYTEKLRRELPDFLRKYKIFSMFDAGCNDISWMSTINQQVKYHGGDISEAMVRHAQFVHPELDIILHDATTDPLPKVDLLFVKDVTIHLNNADKKKVIQNWLNSDIPWLMVTHDEFDDNVDFKYADGFPFASVNWEKAPWNFPKPIDCIYEIQKDNAGRCMALWHRDQIAGLL